jgi:hypothetical protein
MPRHASKPIAGLVVVRQSTIRLGRRGAGIMHGHADWRGARHRSARRTRNLEGSATSVFDQLVAPRRSTCWPNRRVVTAPGRFAALWIAIRARGDMVRVIRHTHPIGLHSQAARCVQLGGQRFDWRDKRHFSEAILQSRHDLLATSWMRGQCARTRARRITPHANAAVLQELASVAKTQPTDRGIRAPPAQAAPRQSKTLAPDRAGKGWRRRSHRRVRR